MIEVQQPHGQSRQPQRRGRDNPDRETPHSERYPHSPPDATTPRAHISA